MSKLAVLLTGAAGRVGQALLPTFRERFDVRAYDLKPVDGVESIVGDLQNLDLLRQAMQGVDVVVHLAGIPNRAPFVEQLVPNNIIGTYNILTIATEMKVRRVVYASSSTTVNKGVVKGTLDESAPYRPMGLYPVSKAFGEIAGQWANYRFGLEFITIRVGWFFRPENEQLRGMEYARQIWLSPNDAAQIFAAAVETPNVSCETVYATSIVEGELKLSLDHAKEVFGYEPQDRLE